MTTRTSDVAWRNVELSTEQRLSVAGKLGRPVRRAHALPPSGVATHAGWLTMDMTAVAEQNPLPPYLNARIGDYLAQLGPFDPAVVHGNMADTDVFVKDVRLAGIVDWGDAMATDRHYGSARRPVDGTA